MNDPVPFLALVIYPSSPEGQSRQAENLVRLTAEKLRTLAGFLRGRVYLSEDGNSLVTLTEWRDRPSFEEFRRSEYGRAAVALTAGLHPTSYWLRQHAAVEAP